MVQGMFIAMQVHSAGIRSPIGWRIAGGSLRFWLKRNDMLSPRIMNSSRTSAAIGGVSMSASSALPRRSDSWHTGARVAGN